MENTPMGCADDLRSILENFKNDPKSRSVTNFLQQLYSHPNSIRFLLPAKAPASPVVPILQCGKPT